MQKAARSKRMDRWLRHLNTIQRTGFDPCPCHTVPVRGGASQLRWIFHSWSVAADSQFQSLCSRHCQSGPSSGSHFQSLALKCASSIYPVLLKCQAHPTPLPDLLHSLHLLPVSLFWPIYLKQTPLASSLLPGCYQQGLEITEDTGYLLSLHVPIPFWSGAATTWKGETCSVLLWRQHVQSLVMVSSCERTELVREGWTLQRLQLLNSMKSLQRICGLQHFKGL